MGLFVTFFEYAWAKMCKRRAAPATLVPLDFPKAGGTLPLRRLAPVTCLVTILESLFSFRTAEMGIPCPTTGDAVDISHE